MMLFLNRLGNRVLRNGLTKYNSKQIYSPCILRTISTPSFHTKQDSLQLCTRHAAHLPLHHRLYSSTNRSSESSKLMGKEQANQDNEKSAILFTEEVAKLSYYQRCRKLFVQYWYVLFPCHGATGLIWFGSLFLVAQSGVIDHHDLVKLLETLYFPEIIVKPLRNPNLGNLAVAYALFKLVAPARYLLTLAITVPLIKELVRRGLIKRVIKK